MGGGDERPATFRDVFAVGSFRALWSAQVLSLIGDQFSRVALSVLVFERTGSPLLTSVTYALSFLPYLIGGPLLSGIADRFPRRRVMIICDVLRAALVAVMAVPGIPLWVLLVLLFVAQLGTAPFGAARAALTPRILTGDRYVAGIAVFRTTQSAGDIAGFALGGLAVAAVGARGALLIDAVTFLASAALLLWGVRVDDPGADASAVGGGWWAQVRSGAVLVFGNPVLRTLTFLAWLTAFYSVPQALAAPIAAERGGGAVAVGLLLAAGPVGTTIGVLALSRFVAPARRVRWMVPMAVLTCVPLLVCLARPGLLVTGLLFVLSGLFSAYHLPAQTSFVLAVPDRRRGQAIGLVDTGIISGQALGFLAAGAAAEYLPPLTVVAAAGLVGLLATTALATAQRGLVYTQRAPA